jgi:hypothetical protein
MNRLLASLFTIIAVSLLPFIVIAQTKFEAGYFVDIQGNRTECLIRNDDWLRSPTSIHYKTGTNSDQKSIPISQLKAFGVSDAQYTCLELKMDTSSQDTKTLSYARAPEWDTRYVALKTLVDGKAKLYHYDDQKIILYFYSVDDSPVEQLEFKSYFIFVQKDRTLKIGQNLNYINQLKNKVSCGDVFTKYATNKFRYRTDFLTDYFDRYNKCAGGEQSATKQVARKKERFHLKLTPGVNFGKSSVIPTYTTTDKYSDATPAFRIGADAELVLPFKNNKWIIFVEPTFQSFSVDKHVPVEYSSIELPLGVRHYFFINDNFSITLDASVVLDLLLDLKAQVNARDNVSIDDAQEPSYAFGVGAGYKRFSLGCRFYLERYKFDQGFNYEFSYKQVSVIAGFRLF